MSYDIPVIVCEICETIYAEGTPMYYGYIGGIETYACWDCEGEFDVPVE